MMGRGRVVRLLGWVMVLSVEGLAVVGGLAANVAASQTRWPGVLNVVRQHPWRTLTIITALAVLAGWWLWRSDHDSSPPGPLPPAAGGQIFNVGAGEVVKVHPGTPPSPDRPAPPRLGRPIGECDPLVLEVHRAIEVIGGGDQPVLPAYVRRVHDVQLNEVVAAVTAGISRLAVLVGGSSTGKTRACWEAVQALPDSWWLWHPYDPTRPEAAAQALAEVSPYTVVWLNEAQHYLVPTDPALGERIAAGLRTLLADPARGPVLVLATIWPRHWITLTTPPPAGQPDPYAQARQVLAGTDIRVADAFTPADLQELRAAAAGDVRLRHAADHAADGRITQHLAGVPELLARYRNAEPVARAVIDVAIDARRLGYPIPIAHILLEQATPGYLTDHEWAQAGGDWLEQALVYTAKPCHGVPGPLTRIRSRPGDPSTNGDGQPCYRLADYLEQTGRTERAGKFPPDSFWVTATATVTDADLLRQLGQQAERRGRYQHAIHLYRQAADRGAPMALRYLARLRERAGDHAGAEALYQQAADRGDIDALWNLAELREQAGDRTTADRLRRFGLTGDGRPAASLDFDPPAASSISQF